MRKEKGSTSAQSQMESVFLPVGCSGNYFDLLYSDVAHAFSTVLVDQGCESDIGNPASGSG
ncbi:MAG: hypothetical protein ABSF90_01475 [Syntrophobacteraceae bacterium]